MARISMNELTTYRWSFEEDVRQYAEANIPAIAVWRQKLSDFGDAKGIELIRDHKLDVSCLMWAGGFTGSDGRSYKESVQDAVEAIQLAADMEAGCLIVYSGARAGHTHNHARRLLNNALEELLPVAQQHSVTLALEPVHSGCARDWTFLTDLKEACRVVQQFDNMRLRLAFDTYYFGFDAELVEFIAEQIGTVAIVHLGDGQDVPDGEQNRCLLGNGVLPVAAIVRRLITAGYQGTFDVKLMGEEIENTEYRELLTQSAHSVRSWITEDH